VEREPPDSRYGMEARRSGAPGAGAGLPGHFRIPDGDAAGAATGPALGEAPTEGGTNVRWTH
jgi:hypothetical protein